MLLQTANPHPPLPPLTQMVVYRRGAHNNPSEVKNIVANLVNVLLLETSIKADPLVYELTNPVQDEQDLTAALDLPEQHEEGRHL